MTSLTIDAAPRANHVHCTDDELVVSLVDGRGLSVPLLWFPRLAGATIAEREDYQLLGDGQGIHWPKLDEDISVAGLLAGRRSVETLPASTNRPGN